MRFSRLVEGERGRGGVAGAEERGGAEEEGGRGGAVAECVAEVGEGDMGCSLSEREEEAGEGVLEPVPLQVLNLRGSLGCLKTFSVEGLSILGALSFTNTLRVGSGGRSGPLEEGCREALGAEEAEAEEAEEAEAEAEEGSSGPSRRIRR